MMRDETFAVFGETFNDVAVRRLLSSVDVRTWGRASQLWPARGGGASMDCMTTDMLGTGTNSRRAAVFDANQRAPFALENAPLWLRSLPPSLVNRAPDRWGSITSPPRLHNAAAQPATAPAPTPAPSPKER